MEQGPHGGGGVVREKKPSKSHRLVEMASTTSLFIIFSTIPFSIFVLFCSGLCCYTLSNSYILLT